MHNVLIPVPTPHTLHTGMIIHACDPSTGEVEERESEVQSHQSHSGSRETISKQKYNKGYIGLS